MPDSEQKVLKTQEKRYETRIGLKNIWTEIAPSYNEKFFLKSRRGTKAAKYFE
jgi:hypothetical protein